MEKLRIADAIANFSNKAPRYFRDMVGENTGGFKSIDEFWRSCRDSRDWRLHKVLKYKTSRFSKSLFVISEDVERSSMNSIFEDLVTSGMKITGKDPMHWGENV